MNKAMLYCIQTKKFDQSEKNVLQKVPTREEPELKNDVIMIDSDDNIDAPEPIEIENNNG